MDGARLLSLRPTGRAALLVLAAVAAVYARSAALNGWAYDDDRFIQRNPHVAATRGVAGWLRLLVDPRTVDPDAPTGIVRPLRTLEFALDNALFRLSPAAFHVHSLLWHALAALLLLRLLHLLVGDVRAACVGALVWALHPMQVESVAWISSRGDVATGALTFLALLCALRSRGRDRALVAALAAGAAAMLYKETAVVLPALVFAVRLAHPREGAAGELRPALRAAWPFAVVAALYLVYRAAVQVGATAHATTFVLGGSTAGTVATAVLALGVYVLFAVLPVRPAADWYMQPATGFGHAAVLAAIALHVALIVLAVRGRRRAPLLAAAALLFYAPLVPVANWPFAIGIPTAERFLYLPLSGAALLVAVAVRRLGARSLVPACAAAVALGTASYVRCDDWRDTRTLFEAALAHGGSPRAAAWAAAEQRERGLALERSASGDVAAERRAALRAEARACYETGLARAHESLDLWRRFECVAESVSDVVAAPHTNAASLCLYLDRPGEALWHADRAVAAAGDVFAEPHLDRALALLRLRRPEAAARAIADASHVQAPGADASLARIALRCADACLEAGAPVADLAIDVAEARGARADELAPRRARVADLRAAGPPPGPVGDALREFRETGSAAAAARAAAALDDSAEERGAGVAFARACALEEAGDDAAAAAAFEALRATPGALSDAEGARAHLSVRRIRDACPAWRDRSVPGAR